MIKFANTGTDALHLDLARLSPAQIAAVKQALVNLQDKKFLIFRGEVLLVADISMQIIESNNVISLKVMKSGVSKGTVVMVDLRSLSRPSTCNPYGSWYDYLYCFLENHAKSNPAALIGEDTLLLAQVRSYLDAKYAGVGGVGNNFDISGDGNIIYVKPKAANSLHGLDRIVLFSFENDPEKYDKTVILGSMNSLKDAISDEDANLFFVVDQNTFEPLSVYDINKIITPQPAQTARIRAAASLSAAALGATSCQLPAYPTCYNEQSGSVIPCDQEIDYVEGLKDLWAGWPASLLTLFYADMKKLETLGYTVVRIHDKDPKYAGDGVEFLKALIETPGQFLALALHGTGYVTDPNTGLPLEPDGFIFPMGSIPNTVQAKEDLLRRLAGLYPCYLKELPTEAVQDSCYGGWSGNVLFKAGYGCGSGKLGWGIRLYNTNIRTKAIEAGYPCHGELGAMNNALVTYLDAPSLKSAGRARFDIKLLVNYLLGMGPTELTFASHYNHYPPMLEQEYNINVRNTLDFGGPCQLEGCSDGCTFNLESCSKETAGTNGIMRTVSVPCTMRPGNSGDAHLFPYLTSLSPNSGSLSIFDWGDSQMWFSDAIAANPLLDFKVNGKKAIRSGPTRLSDDRLFSFTLIPEVDVVDSTDYYEFYKKNKARYIPKSILTVKGATARANKIEMIGNPLAAHTAEDTHDDPAYEQPYFPYNKYFWTYNARAFPGKDIKSFKANIPYKIHPWVSNLWVSGQGVQFDFSLDVAPASPCQVLSVDASQCTNLKEIYAKDGAPAFIDSDKKYGNNSLAFALDSDITLFRPGDTLIGPDGNEVDPKNWKYALTVTLSGVQSYWNHFPLQGNNGKPSYWYLDRDHNGLVDAFEGNSDTFPQTKGSFKVYIACAPRKSACCIKNEYGDYSSCEDTTAEDCRAKGGSFKNGNNCLKFNYFGTPGPNGQVKGMCPAHCQQQPQSYKYAKTITSDNCVCGLNPDGSYIYCEDSASDYREVSGYGFGSDNMKCPGTFSAGNTGFGFNKVCYSTSCSGEETIQTATSEDHGPSMPVVDTQPPKIAASCDFGDRIPAPDELGYPSNSGSISCTGGSLTQTNQCYWGGEQVCTTTVTVTVSDPLCPADKYAAQDNNGNIKCCKLNEEWDRERGVCTPIFTSQYCSPTPSPTSSPTPPPAAR